MDTNVHGTVAALMACLARARFVFASSGRRLSPERDGAGRGSIGRRALWTPSVAHQQANAEAYVRRIA